MKKYTEKKPWGKFEQFCHNESVTVKIITVSKVSKLSLQYHNLRDEFWRVISGRGMVIIGDRTLDASVGDEFFIPKKTAHMMMTGESEMEIMEISFGNFDEDDIIRLSDEYKRE